MIFKITLLAFDINSLSTLKQLSIIEYIILE